MSRSFSPEPHNSASLSRLYLSHDTIAAISSGLGGAIALLKISGPRAGESLKKLSHASPPTEKTVQLTKLYDPSSGALLDEALAVWFKGPRSFTGEDVVELHLHGSPFIASRMLEILAREGVRQALPGEFSFRAIRNGKTTLSQAQAVSDLIGASNEGAVALALEKMSGSQNILLKQLADDLRRLATLGEVGIDFSDQDVEEVSLPTLKKTATLIIAQLEALQASYDRGDRLQNGVRVAFVGLPNAGKSSFFNALLGEDRSIVSETAGTTRDIVREKLNLSSPHGSITLRLEDTAGLRQTSDSIEIQGIARSHAAAKNAELVIFVVDPSSSLPDVQKQWDGLVALCGPGLCSRALGVLTKSDIHPNASVQSYSSLKIDQWVKTSASTGKGISEAVDAIVSQCVALVGRKTGEVLLTRLDHLRSTQEGLIHLKRGLAAADIDLFAADVKQALNSLSPLIGDTLPDDILGKIFSDFCIGK